MAKSVHNDVLDASLNYIVSNATRLSVCATEPTTYAQATSTTDYCLGVATIASTDFTGPADGDVSGRKITVNAVTSISVTNSGTAAHVALSDSATSKLLYVTTISNSQAVTAGNTMDTSAWDIEIADPT